MNHAIFDTEIIGTGEPVFLVCVRILETGEKYALWAHKSGHLNKLVKLLNRDDLTWVSFNGTKFDCPLIAAWVSGRDEYEIKELATRIIKEGLMPWDAYRLLGVQGLPIDHIDLIEVAPGVMINLKTYSARLHYPNIVDLPFHHDQDLTNEECRVLEKYCMNDLGVTASLFQLLRPRIELRERMGETYGMDLRSKSDAQIGEAVLKKLAGIRKSDNFPSKVQYVAPLIVKPKHPDLINLVYLLEQEVFAINPANGSPIEPEWMKQPFPFRNGVYKIGLGGLHSQHDIDVCYEADDEWMISDIDAASYYPSIILKCGIVPKLGGNKGELFLAAYEEIYHQRLAAKSNGDKTVADSLKIVLNGSFGKLGSRFCSFYSPDLLLAVTITGQLNLLCLIDDLAKQRGIEVISANTDGIMVRYKKTMRDKMLKTVAAQGKRTGFEYEETQYSRVAIKDVNNYIAIKLDGKIKAKGLYAPAGVLEMKNPTAEICSIAAAEYLRSGTLPEVTIAAQTNIEPFLTVRTINTPGGGIQHTNKVLTDDWWELTPGVWENADGKTVKRKSRPPSYEVYTGGVPFGRVARWYYTTKDLPPITQVNNGNQVAKSEGAKLCLTLPSKLPPDLNKNWYIKEAYEMLKDMGVTVKI
ncbi:MAG TPA: hypothetical protein PL000_11830 [Anaerolineales bacterium]|nr:hypothetical protein [Anaerolineales bacterium]